MKKKTETTFFAQITREITHLKISPIARLVYIELMIYTNSGKTKAYPSQGTLANDLNVSKTTIKKAIDELESNGLLIVDERKLENKQNDTNLYSIIPAYKAKYNQGVGQNMTGGRSNIDPGVGQNPATKDRKLKDRNRNRETYKERNNNKWEKTSMKKTEDQIIAELHEKRLSAGLSKLSKEREDRIRESIHIKPTSERDIHVRRYLDGEIDLIELIKVTDSKPIYILDIRKPENFRCLEQTVIKMGLAEFLN
jgi:DNA-binding transcriptional MocR family regulator